jgi:acyl-CoA reductase-like NAD-dependent aldehyde dehydrogenase
MQSGQSCACAGRVLVDESVYDAFVEKFLAVTEASTISDPLDARGRVRSSDQPDGG